MKSSHRNRWMVTATMLMVGLLALGTTGFAQGGPRSGFGPGTSIFMNQFPALHEAMIGELAEQLGVEAEELNQALQEAQEEALALAQEEGTRSFNLQATVMELAAEKLGLSAEALTEALTFMRQEVLLNARRAFPQTPNNFGPFVPSPSNRGRGRFGPDQGMMNDALLEELAEQLDLEVEELQEMIEAARANLQIETMAAQEHIQILAEKLGITPEELAEAILDTRMESSDSDDPMRPGRPGFGPGQGQGPRGRR